MIIPCDCTMTATTADARTDPIGFLTITIHSLLYTATWKNCIRFESRVRVMSVVLDDLICVTYYTIYYSFNEKKSKREHRIDRTTDDIIHYGRFVRGRPW